MTSPRRHRLVRAVGFAVGLSLPVATLAFLVRSQVPAVLHLDETVIRAATDMTRANPGLRRALLVWEELLQARWVNPACALLIAWTWRRHGLKTRAVWALVTVLVTWGTANGLKYVVQRARPVVEDAVTHSPGFSFPSGHAANTAAVAVTATILVWPLLGRRGRVIVPALAGVVVVVTALDRVLLGVHYPSDVVAGVVLGGGMAVASYLGYLGLHTPAPPAAPATGEDPAAAGGQEDRDA